MAIEYNFMQILDPNSEEKLRIGQVREISEQLVEHLKRIEPQIDAAHRPNTQSAVIQEIIGKWLGEYGFISEYLHAFDETPSTRSRPDFYLDLGDGNGVLVEVERGGAVNNNHDLKDIWKCHLSEKTQHLLLIVPNRNFTKDGANREAPFQRSRSRLSTFFQSPRTRIDVLSLTLIGYGPQDLGST